MYRGAFDKTSSSIREGRWCAHHVIAALAAAYAVIVGTLTLLGYALDVRRLTDWSNDNISMFPNAAACAALSGVGLLLLLVTGDRESGAARIVLRAIAVIVGLVGGLTLLEHLTGANFGIDTLLARRTWGQEAATSPMRIGPPASISYLFIGAALLLATYNARGRRLASALGLALVVIVSLSLIGYWFGSKQFFAAHLTGIAFQTSTALAAIGIGLIASMPEHGLAMVLRRDDAGGQIVRRLLLPIIIIPLGLAWVRLKGQDAGYYDTRFGAAAFALLTIIMLFALLLWTAAGLSRHANLARAAERERTAENNALARLEQASARLWRMQNLQQGLEEMLDATINLLGADKGNIQLFDSKHGVLRIAVHRGFENEFLDYFREVRANDDSACGRALRFREKVILEDVESDEAYAPMRPIARSAGYRAEVSLPLISNDGAPLGMISTHFKAPHRFSEQDLHRLNLYARRAADFIQRCAADDRMQAALAERTEQVQRAERRVAASQRMAAVGTLASGLAHDLNNILMPLGMRLDPLLRSDNLTDDQRSDLMVILALVDHLRSMSRNLSLFARDPDQEGLIGSTELASWSANVRGLIESSLASRDDRRGLSYIRLKCDVPTGLPPVHIAPHRLSQAVLNLVFNARDAILAARATGMYGGSDASPRGCITIEARALPDRAAVALKVTDDGCGMDDHIRQRAIEAFFTTKDRSGDAGVSGSGMGLALVHSICERVGASLDIQSQPSKGTTVTMTLPATRIQEVPVPNVLTAGGTC